MTLIPISVSAIYFCSGALTRDASRHALLRASWFLLVKIKRNFRVREGFVLGLCGWSLPFFVFTCETLLRGFQWTFGWKSRVICIFHKIYTLLSNRVLYSFILFRFAESIKHLRERHSVERAGYEYGFMSFCR